MVMTSPRTRRDSEWQIKKLHHSFRRGTMSDFPRAQIPADGIYESENVILYGDRAEVRSGTKVISSGYANLPCVDGGSAISASKTGTTVTITAGYALTSSNVGDYFQWSDNGKSDIILTVDGSTFTTQSSDAHTATTTGRIRREINAAIWDKVNKKHVILVGTKVYHAAWDVASWTEVICPSNIKPDNTKSNFKQLGSEIYLWNKNGLFVINLSDTYPLLERINNDVEACTIASVAKTNDLVYGRRYTFTLAKMSGNTLTDVYNGNEVVRESAPCAADGNGKDYAEVFTALPVGDESDTYYRLKSTYATSWTPSHFSVLSDAQFKITLNSVTSNIIVDFTGCVTWDDIFSRIQSSARSFFPDIDIYFDGGYTIVENKVSGSVLGYCTAGDGGTDISGSQYLMLTSGQSALTVLALSNDTVVNELSLPNYLSDSFYYYNREYTHYRIYATRDTGANGINPITGIGNDPELFIHVADVPIVKAFVCTFNGTATVTATSGTFSRYDVGSTLYTALGVYAITILTFVSSSQVTVNISELPPNGTYYSTIGTNDPIGFSQAGNTISFESGAGYFDESYVGARLFVSDGTTMVVTGYNSSLSLEVNVSATKSHVGGGFIIKETSSSVYNRKFCDTITDNILSYRIKNHLCKNRFWVPVPNCELGVIVDGFMVSAASGGSSIYQTQLADKMFTGYYDPEFQIDTIEDSIQALRYYPGLVSAICSQSTVSWSTEVIGTDSRPEIGLTTSFLTQRNPAGEKTGTMFPGSIVSIEEGMDILFTNNSEVRVFDGRSYGPNLAEGKIMKRLRKLQHIGASSYDSISGYILWGTESALTSVGSKVIVPFPDVCWRFSIKEEQGVIGGVEFSGDDWLKPPDSISGLEIIDSGNRPMQVIFDNITGKMYWVSTYDGPAGSGLTKTFVDKDDTTGAGTEIAWFIKYGADTGSLMKYDIRHEVSNISIDPYDPAMVDATGHDSNGYRDGLQIDLYAFGKANEWASAYSSALNVDLGGDISFDETPVDKAIQIMIAGNRSECIISEIVNYYTSIEQAAPPNKREMTEGDYQTALATPALWLSRGPNLYKNLATGSSITGTAVPAAGPDGKSNSAFQLTAALSTISVSITSGTILVWVYGTVVLAIGGTPVTLTQVGAVGTWYLYYASGVTKTGVLTLTPPTICRICDLRVYNSDVSSAVRTYLYNDMVRNNGSNTLRLW